MAGEYLRGPIQKLLTDNAGAAGAPNLASAVNIGPFNLGNAIGAWAGGSYVLVVIDGVLKKHAVTAGLIWQDRHEILEGLNAGDVVARAGAFFADGDLVTPIDASSAPVEADLP